MSELDAALANIAIPPATGEEATPDSLGSAAPETAPPADDAAQGQPVGEEIQKDQIGEGEGEVQEKTDEQVLEELRQAAEPQQGDTSTIKELRSLLKTRLDKLQPTDPGQGEATLSDSDREALELVQGIYAYDLENNTPTTVPFIEKLVQKDSSLVEQLLKDVINVPMPGSQINGWTYGHQLLQQIGLDPMKFNDLVKFSRGEISGDAYGIETVPDYVPAEYQEAYKSLNPVLRQDVDIYLNGTDATQKAAALQTLQDKNQILLRTREEAQRQVESERDFNYTVQQEVETQVTNTYDNLLETIGKNPAFQQVKVHSDATVDQFVKGTIINQICALGDPNAVLAKRAADSFQQMGVKVDRAKVTQILKNINDNIEIAVKAEKHAQARKQNTSAQAEEAKQRVSRYVGEAVSLANRIAGEALKKYSPPSSVTTDPQNDRDPNLKAAVRGNANADGRPPEVKSMADLDALILNTAKNIRENAEI